MASFKISTLLAQAAIAGVVAMAAAPVVHAGAVFGVDPTFSGGPAQFQADIITSTGRTRGVLSGDFGSAAGSMAGVGWSRYNLWQLGTEDQAASGSLGTFEFWVEYTYTLTLTNGTLGNVGSDYSISALTANFYGQVRVPGGNPTFNNGGIGADPTVSPSANTKLLATTSLLTGSASINGDGGTSFNPIVAFNLTDDGKKFFVQPDPFYNLAFASFTNTSASVTRDFATDTLYLVTAGQTDFAGRTVPTPAVLLLAGIALAAAGAVTRRRNA